MENGRRPEDYAVREGDDDREEEEKLRAMRAFVESHDPSSKEADEPMLRRFLRARDLRVEKGGGLFLGYLKWRREFVPNGCIVESEVPNEIAQDKVFLQGYDKQARPIVVILGARHFQNKQPDEFKRFVVYLLDKICERWFVNCAILSYFNMVRFGLRESGKICHHLNNASFGIPAGQEKFAVIADLQGWGYSNIDIRGYLGVVSILQDYYPERLGKLFLIHVPRLFATVWKVVYPFIDKKTRTKIIFVEDKALISTLLGDIDEDQLPEKYGGRQPLVPVHHI